MNRKIITVRKIGDSLAVVIPAPITKKIEVGTMFEIEPTESGYTLTELEVQKK